jgi:hypothetical protein
MAADETPADGPSQVIAGKTAVVDPAAYCRQCPHFDPEDNSCENPAATILEVVPDGRFHVVGCPAVTTDGPDFTRVQRD